MKDAKVMLVAYAAILLGIVAIFLYLPTFGYSARLVNRFIDWGLS